MANLDLTKIFKEGQKVYCPMFGYGEVISISNLEEDEYPIRVSFSKVRFIKKLDCGDYERFNEFFTKEGKYIQHVSEDAECVLFPSKEERSWDNFIHNKSYISNEAFMDFLKKKGAYEKFLMNRKFPSRIDDTFIATAFTWGETPEGINFWADIDSEYTKYFISKTSPEKWTVVQWPEIIDLMDLDGFKDNAYPINDEKGMEDFGSSAYFVNENWLNNNEL